ncbi:MAG: hypothetical protein CO093_00970 [Alphaproteobacteria bacterium CG_4_9_14_3_um_filter_47_13]|nr:MAG: hypothetical protein CO093_00970 [Alphaproteobacteria bacterium CG_4_9_14_3_um_filter_47_13]
MINAKQATCGLAGLSLLFTLAGCGRVSEELNNVEGYFIKSSATCVDGLQEETFIKMEKLTKSLTETLEKQDLLPGSPELSGKPLEAFHNIQNAGIKVCFAANITEKKVMYDRDNKTIFVDPSLKTDEAGKVIADYILARHPVFWEPEQKNP